MLRELRELRVRVLVCFVKSIFFDLIFRRVEHKNAKYNAKNDSEFHLFVVFVVCPFMLMFYYKARGVFFALAFCFQPDDNPFSVKESQVSRVTVHNLLVKIGLR